MKLYCETSPQMRDGHLPVPEFGHFPLPQGVSSPEEQAPRKLLALRAVARWFLGAELSQGSECLPPSLEPTLLLCALD